MSVEASESKQAQSPRLSGLRGRFNRSTRAMAQLIIGASALGLLLVSLLVYWRMSYAVSELERAQYGRLATEMRGRVERLVSRDRSRLKEAAFSDELYALVAQGPAAPDTFIRPSFATWFPRQYGDRFVAVYTLDGQKLYAWGDSGAAELEKVAVTNPVLRVLDNREPAAGLVRAGEELYWVAGAPILPTNYGDASQPIRGYLVVSQPFTSQALTSMFDEHPGVLTLSAMTPPKVAFRSDVRSVAGGDSAAIRFALSDLFAQQSTLGEFVISRTEFQSVGRAFHWAALIGILGLAGLVAFGWWVAQRGVVGPPVRLAAALQPVHQGQVPALVASPAPTDEWTTATGAINRLLNNTRATNERFERVFGAVRDGLWEQDLNTGDWSWSSRFRHLLGYADGELPATLQTFEQLLHSDEREYVMVTLQASSGSARPVNLEVRLRQKTGDYAWFRLEATVGTDHNGTPVRFSGRLIDLAPVRAAAARLEQTEASAEGSRKAFGRLVASLGEDLTTRDPDRAADLVTWGRALSGGLTASAGTFDLHDLVQSVAKSAGVEAEVSVAAGVAPSVSGDKELLRQLLRQLVRNASSATKNGKIGIELEHPDGQPADVVRVTVSDHGTVLTTRDQARLLTPLTTGEPAADGPAAGIGLRLTHQLVRHLGGTAGAEFPEVGGTRVWFTVRLTPVKEEYASTAMPDFGTEGTSFWNDSGSASATFQAPPPEEAPAASRTPRSTPKETKFELVADETVMIDLDGAEPVKRSAASMARTPTIVDQLTAGGQAANLASQMATIFLKDAPIRLTELRGAVRAGEPRTAASLAHALRGMANLIGAADLAARCQAVEDGTEGAMFEQAPGLVEQVASELDRITGLLEPMTRQTLPVSPAEAIQPPVDPAMLDQIRSSLSADGMGLGTQLVTLFLAEAPTKITALEAAVQSADRATIRSAASDLRGMCGLVGASPMADLCGRLADESDSGADRISPLKREYSRVQQVLEELLGAKTDA